jgi:hypothetical protein
MIVKQRVDLQSNLPPDEIKKPYKYRTALFKKRVELLKKREFELVSLLSSGFNDK